jgi:hypothetical protein
MRTWWVHSLILPPIPKRRGGEYMTVFDWEIPNELHEKYGKMTLQEIIQLYDDSWNRETDDVKPPHWEIPEYLTYLFKALPKDAANECINEELSAIYRKLDELEAITKKHRHKTIAGLYTEKPAW